jgi:hypothetical protein
VCKQIKPCFEPLRVECESEACYTFNLGGKGHAWQFANEEKWRRLYLEVHRGSSETPLLKEVEPLRLSVSATEKYDKVQKAIRDGLSEMKLWSSNEISPLVSWLKSPTTSVNVDRGLSLVLNALVRQSTLKPFEIIATFTKCRFTVEVRNLDHHVPRWFYGEVKPPVLLDEFLILFPSLYATEVDGTWQLRDNMKDFLRLHEHYRTRHCLNVVQFTKTDREIVVVLRDRAEIVEYIKGAICGCIPVPGRYDRKERRDEPKGVNSPEVVVSSPVVSEALARLSLIWQDPCAKSVLISSPSGSGKEILASSIPYGNGRKTEGLQLLSMATDDQTDLERRLYGYQRADGSIEGGLIAQASGSAIFLDEIHQPEKNKEGSARGSLLRTLEAGTYFPKGSLRPEKVDKVLFVMATSKAIEELAEYKPIDFWTRVTHALRIPHPLDFVPRDGDERGSMENVVEDFFKFFWWEACERQYDIDPIGDPNDLPPHRVPEYRQLCSMIDVIRPNTDAAVEFTPLPKQFARQFLQLLKGHELRPPQFSIRGIRNMVTRLFAIAWSEVAQGQNPWQGPDDAFSKDVTMVFTEIRNLARLT